MIHNPKPLTRSLNRLAWGQQAVAACRKTRRPDGGGRRSKAKARVVRLHERVRNQRRNHSHQISAALVKAYDLIAFENLHIKNMTGALCRRHRGITGLAGGSQGRPEPVRL